MKRNVNHLFCEVIVVGFAVVNNAVHDLDFQLCHAGFITTERASYYRGQLVIYDFLLNDFNDKKIPYVPYVLKRYLCIFITRTGKR